MVESGSFHLAGVATGRSGDQLGSDWLSSPQRQQPHASYTVSPTREFAFAFLRAISKAMAYPEWFSLPARTQHLLADKGKLSPETLFFLRAYTFDDLRQTAEANRSTGLGQRVVYP